MNGDERPIGIEDLVDVDLSDASADQQPSAPWSDADRGIVAKLGEGDVAAFLARAPGRTRASRSSLRRSARSCHGSPRIAAQIGKDCALELKADPKIHLSGARGRHEGRGGQRAIPTTVAATAWRVAQSGSRRSNPGTSRSTAPGSSWTRTSGYSRRATPRLYAFRPKTRVARVGLWPSVSRRQIINLCDCPPVLGGVIPRKTSPLSAPPPRSTRFGSPLILSRVHWVEPKLVAEITYLTWTTDGLLRHTVYVGLREDKQADQVRREAARA